MLRDSAGIRRIREGQERELKEAEDRGDTSAATLVAGRIAWLEEYVAAMELLAVAELKEKLAGAEDDLIGAEATGDGAATRDAKERIAVTQAALLALHDDD